LTDQRSTYEVKTGYMGGVTRKGVDSSEGRTKDTGPEGLRGLLMQPQMEKNMKKKNCEKKKKKKKEEKKKRKKKKTKKKKGTRLCLAKLFIAKTP